MNQEGHPLLIKLDQMLPILAKEIYATPLAFLRENVQNAFDAIRMQIYREKAAGVNSNHRIDINIKGSIVTIVDTGIGMTRSDMKEHYWSIGKTGKNTPEAKAAGVVGTFGIGGMSNFGVADEIKLVSRTRDDSPATVSTARRETLSTSDDCIFYSTDPQLGPRGTILIANVTTTVSASTAASYLQPIVRFVDIPVYVNGNRINGKNPPWGDYSQSHKDHQYQDPFSGTCGNVFAELLISFDSAGRPTVTIENVTINKIAIYCKGILRVQGEALSTYRYGFLLADIGLSTTYSLGGHVDCAQLRPTAGRDTLESDSKALLQKIVEIAELGITLLISSSSELTETNTNFYRYVHTHGKYDLLSLATIRVYGAENRVELQQIREFGSEGEVFFSRNADKRVMEVLSKQGKQIALLSNDYYRGKCEETYLRRYCKAKILDADVTAVKEVKLSEVSEAERVFIFGIQAILRDRYLVEDAKVLPVELTNNAVVWVPKNDRSGLLTIWLDLQHPHAKKIIALKGSLGYGQLIDLFVRDYVFPMIKDAVPSISSEGFEVLLQRLQSNREIMVINPEDILIMEDLASSQSETPERKTSKPYFAYSELSIRKADVIDGNTIEKRAIEQGLNIDDQTDSPEIGIPREVLSMKQVLAQLEIPEKILDFTNQSGLAPWISGLYIALTLEAFSFYKDIIERLPKVQFVWGGYRASYLFFESQEAVLYYDLEFSVILRPAGDKLRETGTISFNREPLFVKNDIFLPIPEEFSDFFLPKTRPIRIVVRHEILTPETQSTLPEQVG